MESEDAKPTSSGTNPRGGGGPRDDEGKRVRVKRKALQAVLEQCQRTLELLRDAELGGGTEREEEVERGDQGEEKRKGEEEPPVSADKEEGDCNSSVGDASTSAGDDDLEADELCDLLKSRLESPNFLEKLGSIHKSVSQNHSDESTSWDLITTRDLWEDKNGDVENDSEEAYVLVSQEDIVDGVACFMAAYLLSLKEMKDVTPSQLQEALSKTFSVKKKKGKFRKAWDGSKVIYNVASWSATAIGIYQNPALLKAATTAFWTSCRVIAKLF